MNLGTTATGAPDHPLRVLCFGEFLWDCVRSSRFAGGAPYNVAYHLRHAGIDARLVSTVGTGALGEGLLEAAVGAGLPTDGVGQSPALPTGTVRAIVRPKGEPAYQIATPAAWDEIVPTPGAMAAATGSQAIVFGSLAQRSETNRATLDRLISWLPRGAERVFDVNLRVPFDDVALVRRRAQQATLLKVNLNEAVRLVDASVGSEPLDLARALARQYRRATICLTAGAKGAGACHQGRWHWEEGRHVAVKDTIGAGDAFLAGFLSVWLRGAEPPAALRAGRKLAEWVVQHPGATPAYAERRAG